MEIRLSTLFALPAAERARAIDALGERANGKPNGQLAALDAEIGELEIRYEMTSEEMRAGFEAGKVRDTADIAGWLMLLRARDRARG